MDEPNIYNRHCQSRTVLARVGDKWSVMILGLLAQSPARFGAIKRACEGVSQKMLTQTLRSLERDYLVTRTVLQEKPLQVEYALTNLGRDLNVQLNGLVQWVLGNYKTIKSHQRQYDAQSFLA